MLQNERQGRDVKASSFERNRTRERDDKRERTREIEGGGGGRKTMQVRSVYTYLYIDA
jgi:hypothetical protein